MYTVYALRIAGEFDVIYIGCTKKTLAERLYGHSQQGVARLFPESSKIAKDKAVLMDEYRAGKVSIEIVGLLRTEDRSQAQNVEQKLIEMLSPRFNANAYLKAAHVAEPVEGERMMTYREAAAEFGYTYQTLRVWVCYGFIKTVNRRIPYSEMLRYVASKKMTGRPRKQAKAA